MNLPTIDQVKAELAKRIGCRDESIHIPPLQWIAEAMDEQYKAIADDLDDLPELVKFAARLEPRLRRQFLNAIKAVKERISIEALEHAVRTGNFQHILEATGIEDLPDALDDVKDTLKEGFKVGGKIGKDALDSSGLKLRFDISNELAEKWAATRSGELIEDITESVRDGVRSVMDRAFSEGRPPRETAKDIRTIVGLTEKQTKNVDKLWDKLVDEDVPLEKIEKRVAKYAEALLKTRSQVIARTETIRASNEGQQQVWLEAVQEGILDPARTKRIWLTAEDRVDIVICEPMDEQEVGLNEPFVTGEGDSVMNPPAHPNCRCSTGLVFERD